MSHRVDMDLISQLLLHNRPPSSINRMGMARVEDCNNAQPPHRNRNNDDFTDSSDDDDEGRPPPVLQGAGTGTTANNNLMDDGEGGKDLVFSPYYYVLRYSRVLKRSEVLGFGFISLIVACIGLQALIGLEAVGFSLSPIRFRPRASSIPDPPSVHSFPAHTFSYKTLSDFFISDSVSGIERDCLFLHKNKRTRLQRQLHQSESTPKDKENESEPDELIEQLMERMSLLLPSENELVDEFSTQNYTHRYPCGIPRIPDPWTWFAKYLLQIFLPLLNICCAIFLLTCIRCRRRKGFQFTLMLPSFLAVFLGIFQQVPMLFTYSYTGVYLLDEMNDAAYRSIPPILIAPVWEETQYHGRCCGIHSADTWIIPGRDLYPISCCNTDRFPCTHKYASRQEVWSTGCYTQEYEKIRYYELISMIILLLKLVAEMGLLWSLSDLTRYVYPHPQEQHNSTCDVRDFEVRTRGCATILGVTERGKMVVGLKSFQRRKYTFRVNQTGTFKTITIRSVDGSAGSVEIRRIRRNRNTEEATVNLNRTKTEGLIFLTF